MGHLVSVTLRGAGDVLASEQGDVFVIARDRLNLSQNCLSSCFMVVIAANRFRSANKKATRETGDLARREN